MYSTLLDLFFAAPLLFLTVTSLMAVRLNRAEGHGRPHANAGSAVYFICREYLRLLVYQLIYVTVAPAEIILRGRRKPGAADADKASSADKPVVVLIHGYLSTPSHWLFHKLKLKRAGYGDVLRFYYNPFSGTLTDWAGSLAQTVEERFPSRTVIFAGHSLGGLVAIRAASMMPEGRVTKVVTMGSPIKGTLMARFALTPVARQLTRDSPVIVEIGKEIKSLKAELVCCWSRWDTVIVPPRSAAPEEGDCVELDGLGHSGYCFDSRVLSHIIENPGS